MGHIAFQHWMRHRVQDRFLTNKAVTGSNDSNVGRCHYSRLCPLFILRRQPANGSKLRGKDIDMVKMFCTLQKWRNAFRRFHLASTHHSERQCAYCSILLTSYEAKASTHDTTITSSFCPFLWGALFVCPGFTSSTIYQPQSLWLKLVALWSIIRNSWHSSFWRT